MLGLQKRFGLCFSQQFFKQFNRILLPEVTSFMSCPSHKIIVKAAAFNNRIIFTIKNNWRFMEL